MPAIKAKLKHLCPFFGVRPFTPTNIDNKCNEYSSSYYPKHTPKLIVARHGNINLCVSTTKSSNEGFSAYMVPIFSHAALYVGTSIHPRTSLYRKYR